MGSVLPGSYLPNEDQSFAELLTCGTDVHLHPFLHDLEDPFVLGEPEQLQSTLLIGAKASPPLDHVIYKLSLLGEASSGATVPWFAHVLDHTVALVEDHGHGEVQSHGYCSSVVATVEVSGFEVHPYFRVFNFFFDCTNSFSILISFGNSITHITLHFLVQIFAPIFALDSPYK